MFILRMVSRQKPEIFELFPQAAASVSEFALSHLDHVTVDMVHNEIVANIIPGLKQVVEDEDVPADSEQSQLLSYYTAQPPSISTVRRWMHYLDLGFTHDKFKKSYYVDGHEREEQIQHRRQFTTRYLSDIEKFTYQWVQMPVAKLQSIQSSLSEDEKIIPCGHRYWDPVTNEEWVEFHVDDHDFEDCAVELYGGNLSVWMPAGFKPIIILHDPMKDNLARQQAAYVESHGVPMPRSMQAHALTQMFALQFILFKDSEDESNARRELHDPDYWHALAPGSSTDPDELRAALLALPRSAADADDVAPTSASASSPPFFDPEEVISRLREEGYCVLAPAPGRDRARSWRPSRPRCGPRPCRPISSTSTTPPGCSLPSIIVCPE